ncbi:hypothetical protein PIB30_036407 [Stylosanthes scabra]|uniref:MOM1 alpha-helical domain-containing protein n=1 Tax=Stylosanthes scabra TaxID=79078 RepID=A0ABU6RDK0_9FABA|nr:hypothetical protein [Stylosanthes scabra]
MKTVPTTPIAGNRRSGRLEKKTPPAKGSSDKKKIEKPAAAVVATPLRRSGRLCSSGDGHSSGPPSKGSNSKSFGSCSTEEKRKCVKRLRVEDKEEEEKEERAGSDSKVKNKRLHARVYRATWKSEDCCGDSNKMDKSTQEGDKDRGSKVKNDSVVPSGDGKAKEMTAESRSSDPEEDLSLENNVAPSSATTDEARLASESNQSDCCGEETSETVVSTNTMSSHSRLSGPPEELTEKNANLSSSVPSNAPNHQSSAGPESDQSNCNGNETLLLENSVLNESSVQKRDKGEDLISSKRKGTVVDVHSDVSATLVDDENCNLAVDADPSKLCGSTGGTNGPCSKRIRRISLSDVKSDQRKLINNVDQLSPGVDGVKLSSRDKEGKSLGDDAEYIRKKQRSLHLLLKPEIAKLCELLLLPDNVKKMADSCLQYVLNNRQICTKPVSILQAFQLSLCWIAASLLKHKLDFEASIKVAKQHLNFVCKKEMVDEIYSMLWGLREEILSHVRNHGIIDSSKAPECKVAPVVNSANNDTPESTKEISKYENQDGNIHLMHKEEKQKLKADMEKEKTELERRVKLQWAAIKRCSPNDVMRRERLKLFTSEYLKRVRELNSQHEIRLKDLEAKQLKSLQKPNMVEAISRPGSKVGLSKSPDNSIALPGDTLSKPWNSREQSSGGAASAADEAQEGEKMSGETSDVPSGEQRTVTVVQLSSNGGIWYRETSNVRNEEATPDDESNVSINGETKIQSSGGAASAADEAQEGEKMSGETSDVPSGEQRTVTAVLLSSNGGIWYRETSDVRNEEATPADESNVSINGETKIQSSGGAASTADEAQEGEKMSGERSDVPIGEQRTVTVVQLSSNGGIWYRETSDVPNEEATPADESNVSINGETSNLPSSDEGIASLNLGSPREHAYTLNESEKSAQTCEAYDGNGSNNAVSLNSHLTGERIAAGAIVGVPDGEAHVDMPGTVNDSHCPENVTAVNPSSSMQQIPNGVVNVLVLEEELCRPFGTDGNATTILNQPLLEKQNLDGDSSSTIPAGEITIEVPENAEEASIVASDMELLEEMLSSPLNQASVGALGQRNTTLFPTTPSLPQQIPDTILPSIPDGQVSAEVPETSHEVAECRLTETVNTSTTSDQQEGVVTMAENTLAQGTAISRPVDITEPLEQLQPTSSVQSLPDTDGVRDMQDSLVSGPVDTVPANQSNQSSQVVEPQEQMQQLPGAELLPSNQDLSNLPLAAGIENQQTNVHTASNEDVGQRSSNLGLVSSMPGGVRAQSLDTRNLSTSSGFNNLHIQTAGASASGIGPPISRDPLKNELERIRRLGEKNIKNHEDEQQRKELDTHYKTVRLNQVLAEAFRIKNHNATGSSGMPQDPSFSQQLLQYITQQIACRTPQVGSPSCGPIGRSQTVAPPPPRRTYNTTGVFSSAPARLPHPHPMPSSSVNVQASGEIRAPAPHLQPYRPSTPVPASGPGTAPPGMPTQPAYSNISLSPVSFPSQSPLQLPRNHQPDPHRGPSPVSAGGLLPPNSSANSQSDKNAPNILPRLSHLASLDLMKRLGSGSSNRPPNASVQTTSDNVVCLSDDDDQ